MEAAVSRIFWAIDQREPIAVYGDYDVDGVTATVLMVEVLRAYEGVVREYIPDRFEEGYGLNKEALAKLAEEGVRLVITVDCGIRSPDEALFARQAGLDLIISDHHHPHGDVPEACAVICPRRAGNRYPEVNLAGVGLAYKIAEALFQRRPIEGRQCTDWLDLVALGTVADIVPLDGENRVLVRRGLERMRWGGRQGLVSLAGVAGKNISQISASDIGFALGPRLNASGRLEKALASFNLLVDRDVMTAGKLAQELDDYNHRRQVTTQQMQDEADLQLAERGAANIIIAVHPTFNPGVVGLVASKLSERYYRPAVVAHQGEEFTRASCRSIPEFHITDALDECADLFVRHGGHAAAAGFTVRNERLPELIERLNAIADRELGQRELCPVLRADLELPLSSLHPNYLRWLDQLQPTGAHNPEVTFVSRGLRVVKARPVGAEAQHLKLVVTDGRITFDAIAFRQGHWANQLPPQIDLLYQFERNSFNGIDSLQLNVRDLKPTGQPDE
jgi:single-stranded-DNA-specific exonuclease